MPENRLPVVGASMPVALLPRYRDWLLEGQRDLEIQDAYFPAVLDGDAKPVIRRVRELLDGYTGRLGIHGPYDGLTLTSGDPRVRAFVAERLRRGLEVGAELGATHMVVHSPFSFFGDAFVPHSVGHGRAAQIELAHATLASVLPLAREASCTLVIENIHDKNPAPLLALVRSFDSEHVRLSLDAGHAFIMHRNGGAPPDQWAREGADLLAHLHLQDTDGNYDRHWAIGDGAINWYALFEALATAAQRPRLIIEAEVENGVERSAAWLVERGLAR